MKRLILGVIVLCLAYFAFGWLAVRLGYLSMSDYLAYAGVVGSIAGVAGLVSFVRPAITQSDILSLETANLKSLADTSEEIKNLQQKKNQTNDELLDLEIRRKEMELIVKKASLALFLQDRYSHYETLILDEVQKNNVLRESVEKTIETNEKLNALNEEINSHPAALVIREIISTAQKDKDELRIEFVNRGPLSALTYYIIQVLRISIGR